MHALEIRDTLDCTKEFVAWDRFWSSGARVCMKQLERVLETLSAIVRQSRT